MQRVGFIGLGIMGKPMAVNLVAAGYSLTVHNRSRGVVASWMSCAGGARRRPGPRPRWRLAATW